MKKLIISTLAVLALTTTAMATDLPNKKKAPEAKPVLVEKEVAKPASTDSLTVSYAQDLGNNFGAKVDDSYTVSYSHSLGGGFSVGGFVNPVQTTANALKMNMEAQAGYKLPAFSGVTLGGKVGVGERFLTTGNFPYYALYGTADYAVGGGFTINALQYRYRNSFDPATYSYESHQLKTGVTYDITSNYSIGVSVSRSYDNAWNATGDAIGGALTVKF